mgnify:CR=1 FL=1
MTDFHPEQRVSENAGDVTRSEELDAVRDVIGAIPGVLGYCAFYGGAGKRNSGNLIQLHDRIGSFHERYGALRLHFTRNGIVFKGDGTYTAIEDGSGIAPFFYRDGLLWLEFQPGIALDELATLFRIVQMNRTPRDDSDGDIVTSLWRAELQHIAYEASDVFLSAETFLNFNALNNYQKNFGPPVADCSSTAAAGRDMIMDLAGKIQPSTAADADDDSITGAAAFGLNRSLWRLDSTEAQKIQAMVREEESRRENSDVFDILAVVLRQEKDEANYQDILEFFREEFVFFLETRKFTQAAGLLEKIYDLRRYCDYDRQWTIDLINDFLDDLAGPEILTSLETVPPEQSTVDAAAIQDLATVLALLPPRAIVTLADLLPRVDHPRLKQVFIDTIERLARKDRARAMQVLYSSNESDLLVRLLAGLRQWGGIVENFRYERFLAFPDARVRTQAVKVGLINKSSEYEKIFSLIEDPCESVREQVFEYLGRGRNPVFENMMIDYMARRDFQHKDPELIRNCYQVLGRCGTARGMEYLADVVLGKPLNEWLGYRGPEHRKNAARALLYFKSRRARKILRRGAGSIFPAVRKACKPLIRNTNVVES